MTIAPEVRADARFLIDIFPYNQADIDYAEFMMDLWANFAKFAYVDDIFSINQKLYRIQAHGFYIQIRIANLYKLCDFSQILLHFAQTCKALLHDRGMLRNCSVILSA